MDAALLAMISALLAAVLASVFDQRREGAKTRDAIGLLSTQVAGLTATSTTHSQQLADNGQRLTRLGEQMTDLNTQVAGLTATSAAHSQQLADLKEDHRTTQEQLGQINSGLGHARERLAHIEGYLAMRTETPDEVDAGA